MAAASERGFLREAWSLAWPYWRSDEKWSAIGLLVAVVALNLFSVWLNVRFNLWNNDFYNACRNTTGRDSGGSSASSGCSRSR